MPLKLKTVLSPKGQQNARRHKNMMKHLRIAKAMPLSHPDRKGHFLKAKELFDGYLAKDEKEMELIKAEMLDVESK